MKKVLLFLLIAVSQLYSQTHRDVDSLLNLIRNNPDKEVPQEW